MKKEFSIARYTFNKEFIMQGLLTVISEGQSTTLIYTDALIDETAMELYHPLSALDNLRTILETKYKSFLNCNGCRIDTAHRHTGGWGTYKIEYGKQDTESLNIFDSTDEISMLCTIDDHKVAYKKWLDSLK